MIKNSWYIVCFERELRKRKPIQRRIVGQDVVVFQTKGGDTAVLEDRCCHRNVHLSLGSVCNETIQCGYHGWEYDKDGICTHIPSLPDDRQIPKAARIKAYPVQIKHKIVWAFFGDSSEMVNSEIPALNKLDDSPFIFNYHEAEADIEFIGESLYDAHHINYVHQKTIGSIIGSLQNEATDYHLETTDHSMKGWYYRHNHRNFFEKIYFGFKKKIEAHFAYWFPHTSMLDLHFPMRRMTIYQHYYEIDEGKCMIIQITAWKNILRFAPWLTSLFMNWKSKKIVKEDVQFLESNREWHKNRKLNDLLVPADELSFAYKKLWIRNLHKKPASGHVQKIPQMPEDIHSN